MNNEERINQIMNMPYEEKVKCARANYEAIMASVDTSWQQVKPDDADHPVNAVRKSMYVLSAVIVFGNYCFSEVESNFLTEAIDLEKSMINELKHDCKEYFIDAVQVFRKYLHTEQREQLTEIMLLLATVDGHTSKKEMKWINKTLEFIV